MNITNENIIEIQTFHPHDRQEISNTSRINLLQPKKGEDTTTNKTELTIKNEFRALCAITNLNKVMIFIYVVLAFDFSKNLLQTYLMTYNLTDIYNVENSLLYIVRYSITLNNTIGLLNTIIVYQEYNELKKKRKNDYNKKSKKNNVDEDEEKSIDVDFELKVPLPIGKIKRIRMVRLIAWFINTLLFVIFVVINKTMNVFEYMDILLNIVECFLLQLMRFYYCVLVRIEAYKAVYDLKEN